MEKGVHTAGNAGELTVMIDGLLLNTNRAI
jgi:hypothetical protein